MAGYWNRVLERRVNRRRTLIATSTTAAAAFLAACGGDDDNGGGSATTGGGSGSSSILINGSEVDTTGSAKRGGVWKAALSRDPQNFDLYNFDPFSQGFANVVGSKLVWIKPSRMKDPDALEVVPDLATWEISPDKLTYTFKISPNAKFSPLSPTFHQGAPQSIANRPFDSEDVASSWRRFATVSSNAGELVGERGGPVESLTTPDKSTVVFKLKQPFSPFLVTLGNASVSYFYINPKEGEDQDASFFNRWQFGGGLSFCTCQASASRSCASDSALSTTLKWRVTVDGIQPCSRSMASSGIIRDGAEVTM
jgi:ABC-type transport system substrate-binding protein